MLTISIKNKKFNVKTLITDKDKSEGMMFKTFDKNFDGLLFLMSDGPHCFWMKNCVVNLDIIMIKDNIITKIHHNCPPCATEPCKNYCGNGDMILELLGGNCKEYGIQEGDEINL